MVFASASTPLGLVDPAKVSVTIDNMRSFHPDRVRLEGDDPISLAILIDVSGSAKDLIPALQQDLPTWAATSLTSKDRISVYALDCALAHPMGFTPPDASRLAAELNIAINSPDIHGGKSHAACSDSLHFRDALNLVSEQMAHLPGRRVILAVTNGYDGGSYIKEPELLSQLRATYVTIFGLTDADPPALPFLFLAPLTAGSLVRASSKQIPKDLDQFLTELQSRFIIQFPEPANLPSGSHHVKIRINSWKAAFVEPAGLQVTTESLSPEAP
ncbi:MAG: hypothetical protein WBY53_09680 [Acidobacteriaceae bacterium]